jgi:hypothetical protein
MALPCDCEHHTHDPSGTGTRTEHEFGLGEGAVTVRSPWGGVFFVCRACFEAGAHAGNTIQVNPAVRWLRADAYCVDFPPSDRVAPQHRES